MGRELAASLRSAWTVNNNLPMAHLRPLRIAYLLQTGIPDTDIFSGPLLHIEAVADGLRNRGHHVRFFMPQQAGLGTSDTVNGSGWEPARSHLSRSLLFRAVESPIRRLQSELHLPYLNLFDSIRYASAASNSLAGSDLLFERFGFMDYGGVLTAARLRIPAILELNGDIAKEMEFLGVELSPAQRRISSVITRRTLSAATAIVCVAAALKQRLVEVMKLDPEKIAVITNGADLSLFCRPQNVDSIRSEFNLPARPIIMFVGSFQPWHGVDLLLDAFARVCAVADAELVLVGEGPGRAKLQEQIRSSNIRGRVRFLGRVSNPKVAGLLAASDIAVVPFPHTSNDIAGSPLKVFEYMAAGRAIVASSAAIHDAVEDGVTGLRVRPADATALAAGILRLLQDPDLRRWLGANARRVAMSRFGWEHTAKRLESLFYEVFERFRGGTMRSSAYSRTGLTG